MGRPGAPPGLTVDTASVQDKDGLGSVAAPRGAADLEHVLKAPALASVDTAKDAKFWKHGGPMGGGYLPEVTPSLAPGAAADKQISKSTGGKPPPAVASKGADPPKKKFTNLAGLPQVYKSKDYAKKDRTEIEEQLQKLRAATAATWAPYAMLREPATEEQRRAQEAREKEEKERERAIKKSKRRARVAALQGLTTSGDDGNAGGGSRPTTGGDVGLREMTLGEAAQAGGPWDLDPAFNREGGDDLLIDDERHVKAPMWVRRQALERLAELCEAGDDEVMKAAIEYTRDNEGSVRSAALHLLGIVAKRGVAEAKERAFECLRDKVASVRYEACYALMNLASLGDKPSRVSKTNLSYTAKDIKVLNRDAEAISQLGKLLEDSTGFVRKAAAEALDKINAGWQRYRYAEVRQDSGLMSPRRARPRPDIAYVTKSPGSMLWGRTITHDDLKPEVKKEENVTSGLKGQQLAAANAAAADQRAAMSKAKGRYTSLGGQKYLWYLDEIRTQRQIRLFEESQQKAAAKVVMDPDLAAAPGARGVTTQWMGIEWVDRTGRQHMGEDIHPLGDGVNKRRDHVQARYNEGYNGFGTPLGYEFI